MRGAAPANPRDGYVDRLVYRPAAQPVTRLLLRTAIPPNLVTVASSTLGIAGGLLVGVGSRVALLGGVACLVASGVLDCSDGELARLRRVESRLGHALDVAGDTMVHLALVAGIAWHLAGEGALPAWPSHLLLGLGIAGSLAAVTWSEATETRRRRAPRWENDVLDRVMGPLSTRDWYVFPASFALAGRLDLLLPAAAVGANVFWLVMLALLVRVLRATHVQGSDARVAQ